MVVAENLKQMGDTSSVTVTDVTATEEGAIKNCEQLTNATIAGVETRIEQTEDETKRIGDLGVHKTSVGNQLCVARSDRDHVATTCCHD